MNFTKATGFTVEWTPLGDDVGTFLHEMMANDGGERYDVVTCLSGSYQPLIAQDLLAPIKTDRLKNWKGVTQELRSSIRSTRRTRSGACRFRSTPTASPISTRTGRT